MSSHQQQTSDVADADPLANHDPQAPLHFGPLATIRDLPWGQILTTLAVVAALWWWAGRDGPSPAPVETVLAPADPAAVTVAPTAPPLVTVHVTGAVKRPGIVQLPGTARVVDAIAAAGGAEPDALEDRLNLAEPLVDGSRIHVPGPDDPDTLPAGGVTLPAGSDGSATSGPVDINSATTEQLDALPGIGPATAAAIVSYREENGRFARAEDLLGVPGIGPAKLEALLPLVAVS